jgi:hypothetical protein
MRRKPKARNWSVGLLSGSNRASAAAAKSRNFISFLVVFTDLLNVGGLRQNLFLLSPIRRGPGN